MSRPQRTQDLGSLRSCRASRAARCVKNPGDRSQDVNCCLATVNQITPGPKQCPECERRQALAKRLAALWQFVTYATALSAASPPRPH